jgi:hypothetical protein
MLAEEPMAIVLHIKMKPELHDLLGREADGQDLPMSELVVRVLARHFRRPDLSEVPRKKLGRPRREIAGTR